MPENLEYIGIDVETKEAAQSLKKLQKRIDDLEDELDGLKRKSSGVGSRLGGLGTIAAKTIAPIASVASAYKAFQVGLAQTGVYDRAITQLRSLGFTAEAADAQWESLRRTAAATAQDGDKLTDTFVRLSRLGVSAGKQELVAFMNIVEGTGRQLSQFTEAVANAIQGEVGELKKFFQNVQKIGDDIVITNNGVTRRIKANAEDITQALVEIGETDFAGVSAQSAATFANELGTLKENAAEAAREGIAPLVEDLTKLFAAINRLQDPQAKLDRAVAQLAVLESMGTAGRPGAARRIREQREKIAELELLFSSMADPVGPGLPSGVGGGVGEGAIPEKPKPIQIPAPEIIGLDHFNEDTRIIVEGYKNVTRKLIGGTKEWTDAVRGRLGVFSQIGEDIDTLNEKTPELTGHIRRLGDEIVALAFDSSDLESVIRVAFTSLIDFLEARERSKLLSEG